MFPILFKVQNTETHVTRYYIFIHRETDYYSPNPGNFIYFGFSLHTLGPETSKRTFLRYTINKSLKQTPEEIKNHILSKYPEAYISIEHCNSTELIVGLL